MPGLKVSYKEAPIWCKRNIPGLCNTGSRPIDTAPTIDWVLNLLHDLAWRIDKITIVADQVDRVVK